MKQEIYHELDQIRQANDGFIRPADVVAFARDETLVLHSHFTLRILKLRRNIAWLKLGH